MIDRKYYEILQSAIPILEIKSVKPLADYVLQEIYAKGVDLPSGFDEYTSPNPMLDTSIMAISTMNTYLEQPTYVTLCVATFCAAYDDMRRGNKLSAFSRFCECVNMLSISPLDDHSDVDMKDHVKFTKDPSGYFRALEIVKSDL